MKSARGLLIAINGQDVGFTYQPNDGTYNRRVRFNVMLRNWLISDSVINMYPLETSKLPYAV